MLWTMIEPPTTKSLLQRIVPRALCKPLLLPTLVYAAAQQAIFLVLLGVAHLLDLPSALDAALRAAQENDCAALASLALRVLTVPLTSALLALVVFLPASVTFTRIEAVLLPADMQPIVASSSVASTSPPKAPAVRSFVAAGRSFDSAARTRMLKLYAKMLGAQIAAVAFVGLQIMVAEVWTTGGERPAASPRARRLS